jgi:hypothetical protein
VRLASLLLVAVLLAGCDSGGDDAPPKSDRERPPAAITRAELSEHLAALQRVADRNGGTRAAGTPGYDTSADYVAARLRDAGWRVRFQSLRFPYFALRRATLRLDGRRLRRERDFQVLSYSGSGRVDGTLRPAGSGCSSSDYAGLRPGEVPLVTRPECFFRVKAEAAERAGAEAMLVDAEASGPRGVFSGTLAGPGVGIPVVLASDRALAGAGAGTPVRIAVDATVERRGLRNVIAETPGGPGERVVMAGAHLDSVVGGPGINDNGSGVAALIEAAEALGPRPPGARVRLAFWGAEELGLLGSRHYVRSLAGDERRRIRAYLNLDMVGSPNAVPEVYTDADKEIARVLRGSTDVNLGGVAAGIGSDHAPFDEAGIAVGGLYTGGPERGARGQPRDACYHLSCDTAGRVDRDVLLQMTRAATRGLRRLSTDAG